MKTTAVLLSLLLVGCSSVKMIGTLGPKELQVYEVTSNGILTASRAIVILNAEGDVAAAPSGITTAGYGPIIASVGSNLVLGAGIAYAGRTLSDSLRSISVQAGGGIELSANTSQIQQGVGALGGL